MRLTTSLYKRFTSLFRPIEASALLATYSTCMYSRLPGADFQNGDGAVRNGIRRVPYVRFIYVFFPETPVCIYIGPFGVSPPLMYRFTDIHTYTPTISGTVGDQVRGDDGWMTKIEIWQI